MTVNSALARLYGSDSDTVYVGPVSATFPTTLDAAPTGFDEVGWLNTDTGITETFLGSINYIRGHQGGGVVRSYMSEAGTQFSFVALESKALTNGLRYTEIESAVTDGVRRSVRSSGQGPKRRKVIIDLFDQDPEFGAALRIMATVDITPNGDRTYINSDIAAYPFLATVIGQYEVLETDLEPETEG